MTIHAHPTLPEAVMEAAEAVHKMAVHILNCLDAGLEGGVRCRSRLCGGTRA
jgi:hypothetical protein